MNGDTVHIVAYYLAMKELEIKDPGEEMDFFGRLNHFPKSVTELAEAIGVTRRHTYNYINSDEVGIRKRKIVDEEVLKGLTSLAPIALVRLKEAIDAGESWAIKEYFKIYGDADSRVSAGQGDKNKMLTSGDSHHERVQLIMRDLVVGQLQEPDAPSPVNADYVIVEDQEDLISDIESLLEG